MSFKVLLHIAVLATLHGTDPTDSIFTAAKVLKPKLRGNVDVGEEGNHFLSDVDQHARYLQVVPPPTEAPSDAPTSTFKPTSEGTSTSTGGTTNTGTDFAREESDDLGTPSPTKTPVITPPVNNTTPPVNNTTPPVNNTTPPVNNTEVVEEEVVEEEVVEEEVVEEEVVEEEVVEEEVVEEEVEEEVVEEEVVEEEVVEEEVVEEEVVEEEVVEENTESPTPVFIPVTPRPTFRFNPFAQPNPLNNGGNIRAQLRTVASRIRPLYNLQGAIERQNRDQANEGVAYIDRGATIAGFSRLSDEKLPEVSTIFV